MRRFMYLSVSVLCLSVAVLIGFLIGSGAVVAQAPEILAGYRVAPEPPDTHHFIMLANGDVYSNTDTHGGEFERSGALFVGNFWGSTVPTPSTTWGNVKSKYEK